MGRTTQEGASSGHNTPGNADRFSEAFSQFPGATCLAAVYDDERAVWGMPDGVVPLNRSTPGMVVVLASSSRLHPHLRPGVRLAVSLLTQSHDSLVRHCDRLSPARDSRQWVATPAGAPVIQDAACWVDCEVTSLHSEGGVVIVTCRAIDVSLADNAHPLIRYQGGYGSFEPGVLSAMASPGVETARRVAELAREPIAALARELRVECGVFAYDDLHTTSLAVANHSPSARNTRLGYRIPVIPPLGIQFVDSGKNGISEEDWLAQLGSASAADTAMVQTQLDRVRERGWSLMLAGPLTLHELDQLVSAYTDPEHTPEDETALLDAIRAMAPFHEPEDLNDDDLYDVIALSVPVEAPDGDTLALIRIHELPRQAAGFEVKSWISLLQETASAVERSYTETRLGLLSSDPYTTPFGGRSADVTRLSRIPLPPVPDVGDTGI